MKEIRIDQCNEIGRMEINGQEMSCGQGVIVDFDGVELTLYVESGNKGYYVIVRRND